MTPDKSRKAMFAACKSLGMDEGDRKAMILALTGKDSSSQFNALDWAKVVDHLNKLTGRNAGGKPGQWRQGCEALGGKIEALLADQKLPWRYLTHGANGKPSMVKRLAGVDRLEFAQAPGLIALITALEKRAAKARVQSARDTNSSSSGVEAI